LLAEHVCSHGCAEGLFGCRKAAVNPYGRALAGLVAGGVFGRQRQVLVGIRHLTSRSLY
jgi:hypothetical protein